MIGRSKFLLHAGAVLCGLAAIPATAADRAAPQLAQQVGEPSMVCDEVRQRFMIQESRLNSLTLNEFFFDAAERGCLELVERFAARGASVESRDRFGNTALLLAAHMGETEVVNWLLENGSDIEHQNLAGSTALLRAVAMNRRRAAKALLDAGADVNRANKKGVAPLTAAAFNGNERMVTMLLEAGAAPRQQDVTGKGAIVYAAAKGFASVVEMLLVAGVEVDAVYGNDLTALMWAAGHSNDVPASEGLETVELLLSHGAGTAFADNRGRTALMIAAERGHREIVARLLAAGADPSVRDKDGHTALDLASDTAVRQALGGS
jgi:ankyrin repeat protein